MSHQSQWLPPKPPKKSRTETLKWNSKTSCFNRHSFPRKKPKRRWWVWLRGVLCLQSADRARCRKGSMVDQLWRRCRMTTNFHRVVAMVHQRAGKLSRRLSMTFCSGLQRAPRSTNSWSSSASSRLSSTWTSSSSSRRIGGVVAVALSWEASSARRRSLGRKNRAWVVDNMINKSTTMRTWVAPIW